MNFPTGLFNVIYADPPWTYDDPMGPFNSQPAENLFGDGVATAPAHSFSLTDQYNTMSLDNIMALPVCDIAAKDCVCFMWAVSPKLPEALVVLSQWGFKFKTVAFVWNKQYKGTANDVRNLGRWTMGSTEVCLLGTKGHPQRITKNVQQAVYAVRGRHSEKPNEVRERIVTLMGDVPRIELFARQRYRGWDVWGNEVPECVEPSLW